MTGSLGGHHAVVLGGSSGLGRATAIALATAGARLTVTSRDIGRARDSASDLPGAGHRGVGFDLAAPQDAAGAVDTFAEMLTADGSADILVLNAGGPPPARAEDVDAAAAADALQYLLLSQITVVRAVLPGMIAQQWGRIVAIGSSGIQQPIPTLALSNIGRSAVAAYLKSLAADVAGRGVTVNMVLPGRIGTGRVADLDAAKSRSSGISVEAVQADSRAAIPAGRYGDPAEFAAAVAFLCSPSASYITGIQLRADGGMVGAY